MSDSIERRLTELRELAGRYAKAAGDRAYLEKFEKSQLAILQKKYMPDFPTVAAQEREARADPEYLRTLEGLRTAVHDAEQARWELEIARMGAGLWQTQQANIRSEHKAYSR